MKTQYKHLLQRTYLVLVFGFMYLPIAVLIAYSFNENKSRAVFTGFSLKWYASLFHNEMILSALGLSLVLAFVSAIIATVLVISVFNFDSAVRKLRENEFDVALLDINLPDGSGLDLCEEIRNRGQHTYIIFITANDKESDMLKGYEVGGADYVTKPFSVTVLCKKVAAVFANLELRTPRHDLFDDGFLKIDFSEQSASLAGESLDFTPKEYRTLFLFVKNPRIILTKRQILEKLWDIDGDFVDEHTLTTIISRIRKKIETDERKYIKTAYGMGYQWIGGEPR